jgi:NAD(P)-dependent dehydrogenase (short-subunit alcohol dehydrogenase family)
MSEQPVALITGGSRGIGRAIADAFAEAGYQVAICARREPKEGSHRFFAADLREADACSNLIEQIFKAFGRLDVLVNNAGGSPPADTSMVSPRFSEKIVRLNLLAPLWLSQAANAVMQIQQEGGVILHIASVSGLRASPTTAAYGAAKAGLLNLTQTQALEWAPKVRVAAISPGLVDTGNAADHYPDLEKIKGTIPAGRFCTPEDVANAAVWLASKNAGYARGTNLVLDGGGDWPAFLRP